MLLRIKTMESSVMGWERKCTFLKDWHFVLVLPHYPEFTNFLFSDIFEMAFSVLCFVMCETGNPNCFLYHDTIYTSYQYLSLVLPVTRYFTQPTHPFHGEIVRWILMEWKCLFQGVNKIWSRLSDIPVSFYCLLPSQNISLTIHH